MPRCYVRKSSRESWSAENMTEAVKQVLEGKMGYMKASELFSVPSSTLERRVKKAREKNSSPCDASKKGMMGRYASVFSVSQEEELKKYIIMFEERLFGLTQGDMGRLAFELAEKIGVPSNFNRGKQQAGKDWVFGFLRRHPDAVLRHRPEAASAKGPSRVAVGHFYSLLDSILVDYKLSPSDIYTVGEAGIITVLNGPSKVVPLRGKKPVGSTAEKGSLVTANLCMSAGGRFMSPMFVFPQDKEDSRTADDASPETVAVYNPDGCMNKGAFIMWFQRFIEYSHPSPDQPVLLLVDGQCSYVKSIEVMKMARESNVILLCLPAHCAPRLQPLDVSFMSSLSTHYEQQVIQWIAQPGRSVTVHEVGQLFSAAFSEVSVKETAVSGFEATGIWPCNRNRVHDLCDPAESTYPLLSLPPTLANRSYGPCLSQPFTATPDPVGNVDSSLHHPEETEPLDAFRHFLSPCGSEKNGGATKSSSSTVQTNFSADVGQPVEGHRTPLGVDSSPEKMAVGEGPHGMVVKTEPLDGEEGNGPWPIEANPHHDEDFEGIGIAGVKVKEEPTGEGDFPSPDDSAAGFHRGATKTGEITAEEVDGEAIRTNGGGHSQCHKGTNGDQCACGSKHAQLSPDEEPRYICYLCDYKCARVAHLKRHMRIHLRDKPYPCSVCDFVTNDRTSIRRHMRTHAGDKPYSCRVCSYKSRLSTSLKVHMRTHTGERPYACTMCDASFARLGTLKKHVRGVHATYI